MNLFIDIDGVLLATEGPKVVLARHARQFLEFALANFDCFWLTTHCKGDARPVLDYLRPFVPADMMPLLEEIKPTTFDVMKTAALEGDFYWIDDSPLQVEINWLRNRGLFDRWFEIDTRKRPNDLLAGMGRLRAACSYRA